MPEITKVRFVFAVPDLKRSTASYTSALGLTVDFEAPGWSFLSRGGFRNTPSIPNAYTAHIVARNLSKIGQPAVRYNVLGCDGHLIVGFCSPIKCSRSCSSSVWV